MATLLPLVEEDERNAKRGGGSSAPGSRQMTPDSAFPSEQDADGSSCNNPCHATIPSFAFFSSSSNFYSSHFGIRTCVVGEIVVQACALRAITFSSFFSLRNNPPSVFPINFRSTFSSTSQPLFLGGKLTAVLPCTLFPFLLVAFSLSLKLSYDRVVKGGSANAVKILSTSFHFISS